MYGTLNMCVIVVIISLDVCVCVRVQYIFCIQYGTIRAMWSPYLKLVKTFLLFCRSSPVRHTSKVADLTVLYIDYRVTLYFVQVTRSLKEAAKKGDKEQTHSWNIQCGVGGGGGGLRFTNFFFSAGRCGYRFGTVPLNFMYRAKLDDLSDRCYIKFIFTFLWLGLWHCKTKDKTSKQ